MFLVLQGRRRHHGVANVSEFCRAASTPGAEKLIHLLKVGDKNSKTLYICLPRIAQATDIEAVADSPHPPNMLVVTLANQAVIDATQKVIDAGIPVVAINSGYSLAEQMGMTFFAGMHEVQAGVKAAEYMIARNVSNPLFVGHGSPPTMQIDRVQYDAPAWERDRWIGFNKTFVEKTGIHPKHQGIAGLTLAEQSIQVASRTVLLQSTSGTQCTTVCLMGTSTHHLSSRVTCGFCVALADMHA